MCFGGKLKWIYFGFMSFMNSFSINILTLDLLNEVLFLVKILWKFCYTLPNENHDPQTCDLRCTRNKETVSKCGFIYNKCEPLPFKQSDCPRANPDFGNKGLIWPIDCYMTKIEVNCCYFSSLHYIFLSNNWLRCLWIVQHSFTCFLWNNRELGNERNTTIQNQEQIVIPTGANQ